MDIRAASGSGNGSAAGSGNGKANESNSNSDSGSASGSGNGKANASKPKKTSPLGSPNPSRDKTSAGVINGLKELYHEKLVRIEENHYFGSFHYQPISDAEIEAKPQGELFLCISG